MKNAMVTSRTGGYFWEECSYISVSTLRSYCDVAKRADVILEYVKRRMANRMREMIFLVCIASIKQLNGILCPDLVFSFQDGKSALT